MFYSASFEIQVIESHCLYQTAINRCYRYQGGCILGIVQLGIMRPHLGIAQFDDYQGPSAVEGRCIVPIVTETIQFDARWGNLGSHQQFPLVLGWAITIHKSRGLTLKRVILAIGNIESTCLQSIDHAESTLNPSSSGSAQQIAEPLVYLLSVESLLKNQINQFLLSYI